MEIQSAISSGLQGYQTASRGVAEAASNINTRAAEERNLQANPEQAQQQVTEVSNTPSVESQIVRLSIERLNGEANIRSIETADEVLGSLIDVKV